MVARALCGCGLDLGDESELIVGRNRNGPWSSKDPRTEPSHAAARATMAASRRQCAPEAVALALPEDLAEAYVALCAEAGPVFHNALGDEPFFPPADPLFRTQLAAKAAAIDDLRLQLRQQTKRTQRADERVAGLENSFTLRYTGLFRKPLAAVRRPRGG
jgi:hypothetical protein